VGINWPGHEANHSPPSSTDVNNACDFTSTPPIRIYGEVLTTKVSSWRGTSLSRGTTLPLPLCCASKIQLFY
jgi:hypothetical protein